MSRKPGIIVKNSFVNGWQKQYVAYIKYISRPDAIRNKHLNEFNVHSLDGYNDYMNNPEKTSGLFTANKNHLTKPERKVLRQQFQQAQDKQSIMWQDVVSFDTPFLVKHGLYDEENHVLDEQAIRQSIREGMTFMLQEEGLKNSALWTAAIHYNTKHIHVHIAIVEPEPTRPFKTFISKKGYEFEARIGRRKYKSLGRFKSVVANSLVNHDDQLMEISNLIRNKLTDQSMILKPNLNFQLNFSLKEVERKLPKDKRLWRYNNNAMKDARVSVDHFISLYLIQFKQKELNQLEKALRKEVDFRKDLYGEGQQGKEKNRAEDYRKNKYHELYTRLGNSLLRELKELDFELEKTNYPKERKTHYFPSHMNLNLVKRMFKDDLEKIRSMKIYRELLKENEENDWPLS